MDKKRIGIIGGSGLYDIEDIEIINQVDVDTPFGAPSDSLIIGKLNDRELVFLPRHGRGHRLLPSEINFQANIWAMKKLGVEWIISVSAVGSLKDEIKPQDIVFVDQFIDRTHKRKSTFFGEGIVGHIMFAHPICESLSDVLYSAGKEVCEEDRIHFGGTYLNMEGPAFSTKAESLLYRSWGIDVIGMTNLTEAKLAREAEICYATMAMVTDYDCWREEGPDAIVNIEMIIENLNQNVATAKNLIKHAVLKISEDRKCACPNALETAIMTSPDSIPQQTKEKLELIVGKYL